MRAAEPRTRAIRRSAFSTDRTVAPHSSIHLTPLEPWTVGFPDVLLTPAIVATRRSAFFFFFFEPKWVRLGGYSVTLDAPPAIGDNSRALYGEKISPGERDLVESFMRQLELETSKALDFRVKISIESIVRGSLKPSALVDGDPTGILNRLLKMAGIAASVGAAALSFEQAVSQYPQAREQLPVLMEDIRAIINNATKSVAAEKGLQLKEGRVELLQASSIESATAEALLALSKDVKPGEGEPMDGV